MERILKQIILHVSLLFVALGFSATAKAELIEYSFSGTLSTASDVGGLLGVTYSVGDAFTGSFSYDSNIADGVADPNYFSGNGPSIVSSVSLSGHQFTGNSSGSIDLQGDTNTFVHLNSWVSNPFIDLAPSPGRLLMVYFLGRNTSFNDTLPTTLNLADFSSTLMQVHGDTGPGGPAFNLAGTITTLEQTAPIVPEPATITLFATGALGLFGYGWRRKRKTTLAAPTTLSCRCEGQVPHSRLVLCPGPRAARRATGWPSGSYRTRNDQRKYLV